MALSKIVCISLLALMIVGCGSSEPKEEVVVQKEEPKLVSNISVEKQPFGKTVDGVAVDLYTLSNKSGMTVKITNYGGIVTSLVVPDKNGQLADVVLGFDTLDKYLAGHPYFGAIIGRYANRIEHAKFSIEGEPFKLTANDGEHHLHGGKEGFDKKVWKAEIVGEETEAGVLLTYLSPDGEEGYPGNFEATVTYLLTEENELKISYSGYCDQLCPINLTNHTYFNLKGEGNGDILDHHLMINADQYTPIDEDFVATGLIKLVKDTPMDFTTQRPIGDTIGKLPHGYDHNYVIIDYVGATRLVATVHEPQSGRALDILSDEPGLQLYTGNFLDGSLTGKSGKSYQKHAGLCLETQHYPNSPNVPHFPNTVVQPGKTRRTTTIYRFYTR
jgi:aldose 1-epimerase